MDTAVYLITKRSGRITVSREILTITKILLIVLKIQQNTKLDIPHEVVKHCAAF